MILRSFVISAGLVLVLAGPAWAVPFCHDDRGGLSIHFGNNFGPDMHEAYLNEADLSELQRRGIDASRVERWNGCIRAFVRQPGGGEAMEFYDPNTMQRIY